jgi:hypothetical protein
LFHQIDSPEARNLTARLSTAWSDGDVEAQWQWLSDAALSRGLTPLPPRAELVDITAYMSTRDAVRELATTIVAEWSQLCWRATVATKSSLKWYAALHPNLELARHLHSTHDIVALHLRILLRGNIYPLAAVQARIVRTSPEAHVEAARCRLCGAAVEDLPHFLLRCPRLDAARGNVQVALRRVCHHPRVLDLIPDATPAADSDGEMVLLALVLGGDLTHHAGLGSFMLPKSRASRDAGACGVHPALDRLAALNAGAKVLRALHDARTQWLQDHSP